MLRNTFSEEEINGDEAQDGRAGGWILRYDWLMVTILNSDWLTVTILSFDWLMVTKPSSD